MDRPLGVAIGGLLVIGICIQLAIALRNRSIKVSPDAADAEKDAERFATELELQLQGELDDAIKSSTPMLPSEKEPLMGISPAVSIPQIRFLEDAKDESSWTTFKRNSRAKLAELAKSLAIRSKDDSASDDTISTNVDTASPNAYDQPAPSETHLQHSPRRQLPLLDSDGALVERSVLVNAKQFSRILKRRLARQMMEEYFHSQPKRKAATSTSIGCMRRPRGSGGRFLTPEQLRQMEAGPLFGGTMAG